MTAIAERSDLGLEARCDCHFCRMETAERDMVLVLLSALRSIENKGTIEIRKRPGWSHEIIQIRREVRLVGTRL